jgi:hypothetical protein
MRPIAILFFLALAPMTSAHTHTGITDTLITMHDGQTVPRFGSLPGNNLVVPAGETVTLPPDTSFDAIEVSGTLKVSREYDTVCRFTNLQVLPGGTLDMGSTSDPVLRQVEFIIRNVAINTTLDPYQWGNGIFNLGTWTACGRYIRQTWTTMEGAPAGATTITVVGDGAGDWQVGDELLIPDTRQMSAYPWSDRWIGPRRESPVRIRAKSGNVLTLTKPLDFEHAAAMSPPLPTTTPEGDYTRDGKVDAVDRAFWSAHYAETSGTSLQTSGDHNGEVVEADFAVWKENVGRTAGEGLASVERFKPYVANASRNIVIRSENPDGVRGHTVTTGEEAVQNLQFVALVGLGRTTAARLNDSDGKVPGTNQVGRYVVHLHHVHARVASYHRGLYVSDSPKWGIVTHGTHDTKTEWCVVDRCVGSGIITEDGPEVRNTFERNFVMGSVGTFDADFPTVPVNGKNGVLGGQPGSEGAGFWFHGLKNRIIGNVAINNKIGINFVHFGALTYNYPSRPGGPLDRPYDKSTARILEFNGNATAANLFAGTETWDCGIRASHLDSWHNGMAQLTAEENGSFNLDNVRCLAQGWITYAIHTNGAYNWQMKVHNSRLEGCAVGCLPVRLNYRITNSTLYNKTNIDWRSSAGFARCDFDIDCLAVPGPSGNNVLIDWTYDKTKLELNGRPYEKSQ